MSAAPLLKNDGLSPAAADGGAPVELGVLSEHEPSSATGVANAADCQGDQRVSMVPDVAKAIIKDGYRINVEKNAGCFAGFSDNAYVQAGCVIVSRAEVMSRSAVLFAIEAPAKDFGSMKGKTLISWVGRLQDKGKETIELAEKAEIQLIDVTAAPRITIAQKLDVLSSQAKVAGHRAVIEATYAFGRFHTAEMTAAGKYPPSQTFVLGCGVAGLAAMGTSKAMGSVVRAWDVRDVSDQCHSMGAKWVTVDFKEAGEGTGGYAKESSDDFKRAQQATFARVLKDMDIAITTAAIPGKRSPLLITKEAVAGMKAGSVIVDLAAVGGGNCELTKPNESYMTENGVTIIGYSDLPSRMANQSSAMYAQNMANLLKHIQGKEKAAALLPNIARHLAAGDDGDIVTRSIVCCNQGKKVKMPPPPNPTALKPKAPPPKEKAKKKAMSPAVASFMSACIMSLGICFLLFLGEGISSALLTTFLLAGAAGYQAVWGVAHALHTPLMAVTNAISGMTAVGGLLLMERVAKPGPLYLAYIAVAFSTINIVGGFVVSQRMLNLFKKKGAKDYSAMFLLSGLILLGAGLTHPELRKAVNSVSALLCVAAIAALAAMSTANVGCKFGIAGVFGALSVTMVSLSAHSLTIAGALMVAGAAFGLLVGYKVSPIQLPQTVAAFHSLVGLAAMCTSIASFWETPKAGANMENIAAVMGDFIGGVTLTGSIIAFGKLNGNLSSKPLNLPGKNFLNLGMLLTVIGLSTYCLMHGDGQTGVTILWLIALLACIMGFHLVGSVGGGDMPVCITVLNSYSGWALVAEGFLLKSTALTIVGSLIGFSGAILTKIMCDAMNRDIFNVLFGGINAAPPAKSGDTGPKEHVETSVPAVAELLSNSKKVLVVPGYGMAMARAQTAMGELASVLQAHEITLKFGVHPVAGRMPGQMNVLLAEAGVPHEWVLEMDEVNPDMENYDAVLVVGANDVVNSAAKEVEGCAIWGMPVIEVWRSKKVIFCKRSMGGGYADLDNPVFYKSNTEMLLGDAKKTADSLAAKVRELLDKV
jgi:NAD(P) transhydrogenase